MADNLGLAACFLSMWASPQGYVALMTCSWFCPERVMQETKANCTGGEHTRVWAPGNEAPSGLVLL